MQVGVGWWLMFEDRWAAVLRFLSRCSFSALQFFFIEVFVALQFFFALQFLCVVVFVRVAIFSHCSFCCVVLVSRAFWGRVGMV